MRNGNRLVRWIILILGISLLMIMSVSIGGRGRITFVESSVGRIITPIYKGFTIVGNSISQKINPILHVWTIKEENQQLRIENEELKQEIMKLTLDNKTYAELKKLKNALKYVDRQHAQQYVSGTVISKDMGNWYNMFVIDVGIDQGVHKNATVINSDGLIGLVYESGNNWSKVVSIIDNNSTVGFEMKRLNNSIDGIITGSVNGSIEGKLFDPKAVVTEGEEIITSGVGIFPKGIPIGNITKVINDKDALLIKIVVKPSVDFKKLDKVTVLLNRNDVFDYEN